MEKISITKMSLWTITFLFFTIVMYYNLTWEHNFTNCYPVNVSQGIYYLLLCGVNIVSRRSIRCFLLNFDYIYMTKYDFYLILTHLSFRCEWFEENIFDELNRSCVFPCKDEENNNNYYQNNINKQIVTTTTYTHSFQIVSAKKWRTKKMSINGKRI